MDGPRACRSPLPHNEVAALLNHLDCLVRRKDRHYLVTNIALDLQKQMTTSEINVFLGGFDVETQPLDVVSSKRLYVQDLLKHANDSVILEVAEGTRQISPHRARVSGRTRQIRKRCSGPRAHPKRPGLCGFAP